MGPVDLRNSINLIPIIPGLLINQNNIIAMETSNLFYEVSESQKIKKYYWKYRNS